MSADQSNINKETGLKKFLLDPKSGVNSVRTYLNDTHNSDTQHEKQQTKAGPGSPPWNQPQFSSTDGHLGPNMNGAVPFNQQFGAPRPTSAASFHPDQSHHQQANQDNQQQAQQQTHPYPHSNSHTPEPSVSGRLGNFVANILDFPAHQNHPEPSHAASPPMAPTPLHPPSPYMGALTQAPGDAPYPAPNHSILYPSTNSLAQHFAGASLGGQPVDMEPFHRPTSALAPPPADVNSATGPVPAPRLYHRMILEFETLKNIFYAARIQPYHNDLIPVVAKLKALAREIWNLRYTRSSEFNYAEAAHQPIIIFWKEQFEQWSDTLEDMHDPILMQRLALVDAENDYPRLAGLSMTFAAPIPQAYADPVAPTAGAAPAGAAVAPAPADAAAAAAAPVKKKVAVKKAAAPAADGEAAPVKKKVVKKAAAADGEAPPVKKKVVKKKVAAE